MKNIFLITLTYLFLSSNLFAQEKPKEDPLRDKVKKAIELMESGQIEESIVILEECMKEDPTNFVFPYEIAYAHELNKNFKAGIKVLEDMKGKYQEPFVDQYYQLLGGLYDYDGQPKKSMEVFMEGLKIHPNSGRLHLEAGVMAAFKNEDYNKALEFWERGIERDPQHSSNYYWASKIFYNTEEEIWAFFYAELFLNLERGSTRTEEISKLLLDIYNKGITVKSKKKIDISFSEEATTIAITPEALNEEGGIEKLASNMLESFRFVFGNTMALSMVDLDLKQIKKRKKLNANDVIQIRKNFLSAWFSSNENKPFSSSPENALFDWWKTIDDKGYFEAYSYWLFAKGDPDNFDIWIRNNEKIYDDFINWFRENPMPVSSEFRVHRNQY